MGILDRFNRRDVQPVQEERIANLGQTLINAGSRGVTYKDVIDPQAARPDLTSAVATRCVNAIAQNAAALDINVLGPDGEVIEGHPMAVLFNRRPNDLHSARFVKEVLFSRLEWRGEAFLYLDRGETGAGDVQSIWPIWADVTPVVDNTMGGNTLSGYQLRTAAGTTVGLLPTEVLWLRYPHPDDPWGSLAPWRGAMQAAGLSRTARAWQQEELANGGRPSSVVYLGDNDDRQHSAGVQEWRAKIEGPRSANRHLLVSGPVPPQVIRLGATTQELAYLDTIQASDADVMLAFGVPHDYLKGGTTYENRDAAKRTLWSDKIVPTLQVVAAEADRQLLPDLAFTFTFDVSGVDALSENLDSIATRTATLLAADALTIDEARQALGFDPLPNNAGTVTITPYRYTYRSAPAPTVTALAADLGLATRVQAPALIGRAKVKPLTRYDIERAYARHELVGKRAVSDLARKQERIVLRNLKRAFNRQAGLDLDAPNEGVVVVPVADGFAVRMNTGDKESVLVRVTGAEIYDAKYWAGETRIALSSFVDGLYTGAAAAQAEALGIDFGRFDNRVLAMMDARLGVLSGQVTDTTQTILENQLLQAGVEAGKSVPDLARDLQGTFENLATWRAELIARTETVGGFNASSREAANESGIVGGRRWLAAGDERVRESHAELDGYETDSMDDEYPNGLMFPADPNGPPEESINCRCVEEYVIDYGAVQ